MAARERRHVGPVASRPAEEASVLVTALSGWRELVGAPLVVAIDGHGAAGKSTLARVVAASQDVTVLHVDDFWRRADTAASGPPCAGSPLAAYYDWSRLRSQALRPLLAGERAEFVAVDPDSPELSARQLEPAPVIVVEGVSAACDALADLVDRSVLVDTPEAVRLARLRARVRPEHWDDAWLAAERAYLATRPAGSFDLIVSGVEAP